MSNAQKYVQTIPKLYNIDIQKCKLNYYLYKIIMVVLLQKKDTMNNNDINNINYINNPASEKENHEENKKPLDNIFKKTKTKPHIYYLPLSEEEVKINLLLFIG
jgi:hypothetical protein